MNIILRRLKKKKINELSFKLYSVHCPVTWLQEFMKIYEICRKTGFLPTKKNGSW